ncbi:pro-cathepsin H [Gymnodraco acuticeps]|uniref:Pro-cathepsin H n=1 Tax=Gymnodraco acuticeps TaxID=8218 RepID=A0A6P8VR19_GYMAC|nr:pro-cathepsin H [Gymnodraco acuticeps]
MQEYHEKLQIFTENKRRIDKHNEGNQTFTMGLNQFADMTFGEFRKYFLLSEPQNCSATKGNHFSSKGPPPDSIDWRKKGNYVTDVKNQSEQQLIDCAQDFNNHGCDGSLPSQAFEYIMYNKGLMTEEDYPYKAIELTCVYKPELAAAFVKDVVNITQYDEKGMVDAVATLNPVSFAFEVTSDFMHYSGGVYTSTECHQTPDMVNHAVLAVGYGQQAGTPNWIVKNSWGSRWGIDGYFLIEREMNMCALAAIFPSGVIPA